MSAGDEGRRQKRVDVSSYSRQTSLPEAAFHRALAGWIMASLKVLETISAFSHAEHLKMLVVAWAYSTLDSSLYLVFDIRQRGLDVAPRLPKQGQRALGGDRHKMNGVRTAASVTSRERVRRSARSRY